MNPNRNALIAIVFIVLLAAGWGVYRIMAVQPLEPPVRVARSDGEPAPASKPPAQQSPLGREAVPTVQSPGDSTEAAVAAGRVRGQIDVSPGETFPAQFELTIEAPPAAPQLLSFTAADRIVALDLPRGRSLLRARAEGLASKSLVLGRNSDAPLPPFRLVLEPAGRLGGKVFDARGFFLVGLPVALVATTYTDVRSVLTDAEGRYAFTDVPVGPYRVAFGASDSPIAPVVPVEVAKNEVRDVPPQTMPELGEAEITVLDRAGNVVEGARVFGQGQRGGWIDGASDRTGIVRARFLPAGSFYLNVATEDGRKGEGPLDVTIGRIGRAVVHIR